MCKPFVINPADWNFDCIVVLVTLSAGKVEL